jgi:transcriptional regulator with GAF, ATPase, and Fis domain
MTRAHGQQDGAGTDAELAQLRRLRELNALLPTLAGVLDLREVFERVSEIAKPAIPHDGMAVVLHDDDGETATVHAITGGRPPGMPESYPVKERGLPPEPWDYEICDDIQGEASPFSERIRKLVKDAGYRSMIRVPLRLEGRLRGTVHFVSSRHAAYRPDDVLVASWVRDHVALALSHHRLAEEARRAAEAHERAIRAEARVRALTAELAAAGGHGRIIAVSPAWKAVLSQAERVAPTEATVLVTGETGTGKEVVARFVHRGSPRASGPFVAINCASLPENLLESELFGFEKGAFTGATQAKPGRIEDAAGGVLFLDEIGEMSLDVQAKLLRFLSEREFQRLGASRPIKADVRLIFATHRDLRAAVSSGAFREDLFYRVSAFEIRIPPLRDRPEDLAALTDAFLADVSRSLHRPPIRISDAARALLRSYRFPGNVRELHNVLERGAILCEGDVILPDHLAVAPAPASAAPAAATATAAAVSPGVPAAPSEADSLEALERATITRVLAESRFNKSAAARRLGLSRGQLYQRLRKYNLSE